MRTSLFDHANVNSLTCHDCLLHPPPLVDLSQDRKVLASFFLKRQVVARDSCPHKILP